ncbi:hypothetical protein VNO80_24353 [Phaseolus coccineus]|uniref:Uncharacterized protein n=1 Tax=Phaseolus coccineus TaxID=3886 RepID=A0AAN9LVV1_PHACN
MRIQCLVPNQYPRAGKDLVVQSHSALCKERNQGVRALESFSNDKGKDILIFKNKDILMLKLLKIRYDCEEAGKENHVRNQQALGRR